MAEFSFQRVTDEAGLAARWRALEAGSAGGFFRSWTFLGTLLPHMAQPWLLAVRENGQDIGLGLFGCLPSRIPWRPGHRFSLGETGRAEYDRLYVEHNGLLLRDGAEAVLSDALRHAVAAGSLVLPGVDDMHFRAARAAGLVTGASSQFAPALSFRALPADRPYLDSISANGRAQIRRAMRLYGDDLTLDAAASASEACLYLGKLVELHEAAWRARGKPGAFSTSRIMDFHTALIRTGHDRGEIALLRAHAQGRDIGYLYNFQHGGCVFSYQSGLVTGTDARLKPGLVCHALAIERARREGFASYDLLAGAQRYKRTLAPQGGETLHWLTLHRSGSLAGRISRAGERMRRLASATVAMAPRSFAARAAAGRTGRL